MFIPDKQKQRFGRAGSDATSLHRIERWQAGLNVMRQYPGFGVGFEAWSDYYSRNYSAEIRGSKLVHNIFIQCGTELGYVGLSLFVLMW